MLERLKDAAEIWERDRSEYPQGSAAHGFIGVLLRIKCSICILLGREKSGYTWDVVPVWISPMSVNYAAPSANWTEVGVGYGWRNWYFARYGNGV